MKKLIVLVGPCGSGKSTLSKELQYPNGQETPEYFYVNQDEQGKVQHKYNFNVAIEDGLNIIVDRMNFNKEQRKRYLEPAKAAGYETEIIVLHESYDTCMQRMLNRENHPTIKDSDDASKALNMFFSKYERPTEDEADVVTFKYPEEYKPLCIVSDLDGTLCDTSKRQHFVQGLPAGVKKNWAGFFAGIPDDAPNRAVMDILDTYDLINMPIVYCSGRSDNLRKVTTDWLEKHYAPSGQLFMRNRHDHREDFVIKEQLLHFEILTRYEILFWLDDRQQVVDKIREHGIIVLQVAPGNF